MLRVVKLSKEFIMHIRGGKKIECFKNVSFEIKKGEFLAVTGPSGIGKSTLLKCIYRSYLPTSGDILYLDINNKLVNIAKADDNLIINLRNKEIGYISQFFHVIPRVSAINIVIDNVSSAIKSYPERKKIAEEYLRKVGISEELWDMYPSTFSGGEKQRLNVVCAVLKKPRLLLLDEPTASLDSNSKKAVISMIENLKQAGTSMIGVFHDYESMKKLADNNFNFAAHMLKELYIN